MNFNGVIFRDDQEELPQLILLEQDFSVIGIPTICINNTSFDNRLTLQNFYIVKIEMVPNRRFDGDFKILKDFDKFDYMIANEMCFEITKRDGKVFTVHQMLREGKFWNYVNKLVQQNNLVEIFASEDIVGDALQGVEE